MTINESVRKLEHDVLVFDVTLAIRGASCPHTATTVLPEGDDNKAFPGHCRTGRFDGEYSWTECKCEKAARAAVGVLGDAQGFKRTAPNARDVAIAAFWEWVQDFGSNQVSGVNTARFERFYDRLTGESQDVTQDTRRLADDVNPLTGILLEARAVLGHVIGEDCWSSGPLRGTPQDDECIPCRTIKRIDAALHSDGLASLTHNTQSTTQDVDSIIEIVEAYADERISKRLADSSGDERFHGAEADEFMAQIRAAVSALATGFHQRPADATEDTRRLDWIQNACPTIHCNFTDPAFTVTTTRAGGEDDEVYADNDVRIAIDKAMHADDREEPNQLADDYATGRGEEQ